MVAGALTSSFGLVSFGLGMSSFSPGLPPPGGGGIM